MWFLFRNSGKDLQTVMDTSGMIFCVKHNFDQVSQKEEKRLVWNVLDIRVKERVELLLSNKMILSANTQCLVRAAS